MINIKQHILALQFKGVVRLFDNNYASAWKTLENLFLTENVFFCILRSNVKLTNMMIAKLAFLRFTRSTLSTLKSVVNASEIPPGNKFLWFNKNVKYQNKLLFIEEFFNAGIFDFEQLPDFDGNMKSYHTLSADFGLTPNNYSFIKHVKMTSAIPLAWQDEAQSNQHFFSFIEKIIQLVALLGKFKKTVYTFLRNKNKVLPIKQQQKWCEILQTLPSSIDWSKVYNNNCFATRETKLRSFQIRLNLKSIVTNLQRHSLEIVDSNCCVFCLEESETIMHLFCNCKFVQMFWCDVSDWLSVKFFYDFNFENRHKLFGFPENNDIFQFINALLLYARFLIYRCKYSKCKPNMAQCFNFVNSIRQSKYFIAKKKHELNVHFRKWSYLR